LLYHQRVKDHLESVNGVELDVGSLSPREIAEGERIDGFRRLRASPAVSSSGSESGVEG